MADQNLQQEISKPKLEPYEIHTMPTKYLKANSPQKGGLGRTIIIILAVVVFLGLAGFGAYYFFTFLQGQTGAPAITNLSTVNLNTNVNQTPLNVNTAPTNTGLGFGNENLNLATNVNLLPEVNLNINAGINTNSAGTAAVTYFSSLDSDRDGLTDVEEDLYGTEVNKPDTDEDGFIDGSELVNLFNPKAGNGSLLVTSGLINPYDNPSFNYEIFYPAKWLARPTDQSLREVIFQSATDEYVSVRVADNASKLSLVDWYVSQFGSEDLGALTQNTTKNGMQALLSENKLTYYMYSDKTPDLVYVISYFIGNRTQVNFSTTFQMMASSFKIVPKP
ncbi:MAG: hypothetical protein PHC97_02835 [Patescibacteria group bacterium]|nr:hypothetical protein [Patescibacteria group bacterium]